MHKQFWGYYKRFFKWFAQFIKKHHKWICRRVDWNVGQEKDKRRES